MKRFSAKLLFQHRINAKGKDYKKRLCEERIILLEAKSAKSALTKAKSSGKKAQHNYLNDEGNSVYFEFIGVMDLLCLEPACEENEVWYDIKKMICPMERKAEILPKESELCAIKNNE